MSRRRCCQPPRLTQPGLGLEGGAGAPQRALPPDPPPGGLASWTSILGRAGRAGSGEPQPPLDRPHPRYLALVVPDLPVARLRRAGLDGPALVWRQRGARREVVAGLGVGWALGDAQALWPEAMVVEEDAAADAAFLEGLALWALRFTPLVAMEGGDGLILDITGCAHLFGGEAALLAEVRDGLARLGVPARGVAAGAPATATALARAGRDGVVVPGGGEAAAVADVPLPALGLDPQLVVALARMGLRCVGEVRRQPRGPLARRFGAGLILALDEAAGELRRPISPVRPPPELEATRGFLEPLITREAIDIAAGLLVRDLCGLLLRAGLGVRRMVLRAFRVDGAVQEVAVGTGLASRDPAHLARLLDRKLERLEPGFGFDRMMLGAEVTEPFAGAQPGLARDAQGEALAQLLDRLAQRVPVWRLAPRASHWPEREVMRVSAFSTLVLPAGWPRRPRPVTLLHRPLEIEAVALLPDAPPSLLRIGRLGQRVRRAEGPERIGPEWWREERPERDYYRVELASGQRLWVCRIGLGAEARWFLHGHLA